MRPDLHPLLASLAALINPLLRSAPGCGSCEPGKVWDKSAAVGLSVGLSALVGGGSRLDARRDEPHHFHHEFLGDGNLNVLAHGDSS